jgi:hypothetical protein
MTRGSAGMVMVARRNSRNYVVDNKGQGAGLLAGFGGMLHFQVSDS